MKDIRQESWYGKQYSFFSHKNCEAFPCHSGIEPDKFNCLFCYCPLYMLGDKCGGNFNYLENNVKDCSSCTIPHHKENYGFIMERLKAYIEQNK